MRDSRISWCRHTFNAWWGCDEVSPGCAFCYARTLARRFGRPELWEGERMLTKTWGQPLAWDREAAAAGERHIVFVNSMSDTFDDHRALWPWRARLWELIAGLDNLVFLLLTKRPENVRRMLDPSLAPRVWLGTTIENAKHEFRAERLLACRDLADALFVSHEPALGPLNGFDGWLGDERVDWLIYGGESGAKHRPDDDSWALADFVACERSGASFFYKQSSGRLPGTVRGTVDPAIVVRNFPPKGATI